MSEGDLDGYTICEYARGCHQDLWLKHYSVHYSDVYVIVRPQSIVEYTSIVSLSTIDCGLTNLIHDSCSSDVERLCLTDLQRHPYVG